MRVLVCHAYYGCDTGCCGHVVQIVDENGNEAGGPRKFEFGHASTMGEADIREYVRDLVTKKLGAEHVADIDWEHCVVLDGDTC